MFFPIWILGQKSKVIRLYETNDHTARLVVLNEARRWHNGDFRHGKKSTKNDFQINFKRPNSLPRCKLNKP